jgi:cytochrome o ubiquinol oxidase subunit 3
MAPSKLVLAGGAAGLGLLLTVLLGCGFLYREISDFIAMAAAGGPPTRSGYLSALWSLVGLHGLHVTGGLIWCLVIVAGILVRGVDLRWKLTLLRWAVFWHFLDVVWIAIFSFVFLGGLLKWKKTKSFVII